METSKSEQPSGKSIVDLVNGQEWLDGWAEAIQPAVAGLFRSGGAAGQRIKDLLNGVWLGHPLHPALTDVPIGAWTAAVLLDGIESATGDRAVGRAADAAVALGLAGSLASAVTGLTDWSDTYGKPRKIGMAHALLNATAALLVTGSLLARARGRRATGRGLSLAGYLLSTGAAYLGGHLVFGQQIGVDHTAGGELPEKFVRVLAEEDLPENKLTRAKAGDIPVLLVKRGRQIFAIAETCAHQGGPLAEGKLEGEDVICPWHASRFSVRTGKVVHGPSCFPQPRFDVRVQKGQIEVRAASR